MFHPTLKVLILFVITVLMSAPSFAQHKGINFQAVIKRPDGTYPSATGVTVTAQILEPTSSCVLREEEHVVNLANGYLNLVLGDTAAVTPFGRNPSPLLSMIQVMDNKAVRTGLKCVDLSNNIVASNQTYLPSSTDRRLLRVRLNIAGDEIVANFNMRASPFAVNSEMLNSKTENDFVNINSAKGVTQNNVESVFDRYTKLDALLNNSNASGSTLGVNVTGNAATATSVSGVVAVANGGTGATSAFAARTNLGLGSLATMTTAGTADTTTFLRGDGTWSPVSGGGAVTSVAGKIGAVTLDAIDIPNLPASKITSGTFGDSLLSGLSIDKLINATAKYFDYRPSGIACANNETLKYATGTGWICATSSSGLGQVGLTLPSDVFEVTGSPLTADGTIASSFKAQTQKRVFAAPNAADGAPSFRQLQLSDLSNAGTAALRNVAVTGDAGPTDLVKGDDSRLTDGRPPLDGSVTDAKVASGISGSKISGNISGSAANVTGTVAVSHGGTGVTALTPNRILASNGSGSMTFFSCAAGQVIGFDASGIYGCYSPGSYSMFVQGGNSVSATAVFGTTNNHDLSFVTNNSEKMLLQSDGKLGVGKSPAYLVDVNGTVNANELRVGGQVIGEGFQDPLRTVASVGASCTILGATAKSTSGDLLVCDEGASAIAGADCSTIGTGALTFDAEGNLYVCAQ